MPINDYFSNLITALMNGGQQQTPPMGTPQPPATTPPPSSPGLMGLSGNDWLQLIGAVASPLQIGNAEVRRRGAGIRPGLALSYGAGLWQQRQSLEDEKARQQALASLAQQAHTDITSTDDPIQQAQRAAKWRGQAIPFAGLGAGGAGQGPRGAGSGMFYAPPDESITAALKAQRDQEEARTRQEELSTLFKQLAIQPGTFNLTETPQPSQPNRVSASLDLRESPPIVPQVTPEHIANFSRLLPKEGMESVVDLLRNQGRVTGPAGYQVEQGDILRRGVEAWLPPSARQSMQRTVEAKPTGIEQKWTTPEAEKPERLAQLVAEYDRLAETQKTRLFGGVNANGLRIEGMNNIPVGDMIGLIRNAERAKMFEERLAAAEGRAPQEGMHSDILPDDAMLAQIKQGISSRIGREASPAQVIQEWAKILIERRNRKTEDVRPR